MRFANIVLFVGVSFALAACDDKRGGATKVEPHPAATTPAPAATNAPAEAPPVEQAHAASAAPASVAAATPAGKTLEVELESVGETMTFNVTTLKAAPGQTVHLTLKNNAKSPLMPHNWALVKRGSEAKVALRGVTLKDDGYLAPNDEDVIAATKLAAPGATVEVTFTAPTALGAYPYICTVPGHYMLMKGTLVVEGTAVSGGS